MSLMKMIMVNAVASCYGCFVSIGKFSTHILFHQHLVLRICMHHSMNDALSLCPRLVGLVNTTIAVLPCCSPILIYCVSWLNCCSVPALSLANYE